MQGAAIEFSIYTILIIFCSFFHFCIFLLFLLLFIFSFFQMKIDKIRKTNHFVPCPYRKQQLESNHPEKLTKPQTFGYNQACALLLAIELNRRTRLSKKCLGNNNYCIDFICIDFFFFFVL